MTQNCGPAGTTRLRRKFALENRDAYSASVRSRPPVSESMATSMNLPKDGMMRRAVARKQFARTAAPKSEEA